MNKNSLFIANIELNENEGIYKKVCAQAVAVKNAAGGEGYLLVKKENGSKYHNLIDNISTNIGKSVLDAAKKIIIDKEIGIIYVRHMIPSFKLISFLNYAKKNNVTIYYEIPTYPYFAEQFRTSRKKYRAIVKIALDVVFWPLIYAVIDHLVVIKSNSKVKMYKKMIEITNGVRTDNIKSKDYSKRKNDNTFRMVTVGTLYPYHGYDRVLHGLADCKEKVEDKIIEFHVIGSSQTIDELKELSKKLNLKHVYFHGTKTTDELNEMYDQFDVGLGCMALHRRNANIDTTLKVIEYYCRGVPVVTSGISPMDSNMKESTIHVNDDEKMLDIVEIYKAYIKITDCILLNISDSAKGIFDWNYIMNNAMRKQE